MSLEGKKILIVGASSEIGKAIALECAHAKAKLYLTYNQNNQAITNFVRDSNISESVLSVKQLSLQDPLSSEMISELQTSQKLDGMVIAAGVHHAGPLMGLEQERILEQISINLTGPILLTQALLPIFVKKRAGSLVFLGSVSAHRVSRGHATYSASKAGLEGFVRALAAELAKRQVRVNCVLPGPVLTPMLQKTIDETGHDVKTMIPIGDYVKAADVSSLVRYLLSDVASSVTGTSIPVDGGYLLW